MINDIET